jgi:predicted ATPase
MRALYAGGRQADALEAYQRARRVLSTELGVEPSAALRELELAILQQRAEVEPAGRAAVLPVYRTRFVGREGEASRLGELVRSPGLVTVLGPGGVGKTRLVIETLRKASGPSVHFVDLSPMRSGDRTQVGTLVAAALGADLGIASIAEAIGDVLERADALLVLDSCEHLVAPTASFVEQLLDAWPDARVIATSRVRLGVDGEVVLRVDPFAVPVSVPERQGELVGSREAVELFVDRAVAVQPAFDPDRELEVVSRLVTRLDGMPLALEMAAARLASMSVSELARRLDDRIERLDSARRNVPERHATLEATVEWSYGLLTSDGQRLLRWLSVFAGGWTVPAMLAVTGRPDAAALDELVSASLVELGAQGDDGRYRLLDTVRDFAWDRLHASGDADTARSAHARWALDLATAHESWLFSEGIEAHRRALDVERDNLEAATAWALDDDAVIGPQLVASLAWWWQLHGAAEHGKALQERALSIETGPTRTRAKLLRMYGAVTSHMDSSDETVAALREAEQLAADLDVPEVGAAALHNLAYALRVRGELDRARATALAALPLWERSEGRESSMALTIGLIADIAVGAGDLEEAERRYAESLVLFREARSRHGVLALLHSTAELAIVRGRLDDVERLLAEAVPLAHEIGDVFHIAVLHQVAGNLALRRNDVRTAATELLLALEQQWSMLRNREACLMTLDTAAELASQAGRPDDAWLLVESIDSSRTAHDLRRPPTYVAAARASRAAAALAVGEHRDALSLIATSWSTDDLVRHACTMLRDVAGG